MNKCIGIDLPPITDGMLAKLMLSYYKDPDKAAKEVFKYHKVIYYNNNGYIVSRPESVLKQMGDEYFKEHSYLGSLYKSKRKKPSVIKDTKMRGSNHIEISLVDNSSCYPVKFETCNEFEGDIFSRYTQKVSNLMKGD